jgi:hypothetical protein
MHRRTTAGLLALMVVVGCSADDGGTDPGSPDADGNDTPSDELELDEVVLSLDDLPSGYTAVPESDSDEDAVCNGESATDRAPAVDEVEGEQFVAGPGGPFIASTALQFADADSANSYLDAWTDLIADCDGHVSSGDPGEAAIDFTPLSFAELGDRTLALRGTASGETLPVTINYVFAQVGDVVVGLGHGGVGFDGPDVEESEELLTTMVDRAG